MINVILLICGAVFFTALGGVLGFFKGWIARENEYNENES